MHEVARKATGGGHGCGSGHGGGSSGHVIGSGHGGGSGHATGSAAGANAAATSQCLHRLMEGSENGGTEALVYVAGAL